MLHHSRLLATWLVALSFNSIASETVSGVFSGEARLQSLPAGNVSQTRSPDNGALSIIFETIKMDDQSMGPSVGVALTTATVPIAPKKSTHIVVDIRGSAALQGDAKCRSVLTTPFGTITALPKKNGNIFARWKVPVHKTSQEFSFTAILQCHKSSGAVSASIDSVDLAWSVLRQK